jgi:hypothetical protein
MRVCARRTERVSPVWYALSVSFGREVAARTRRHRYGPLSLPLPPCGQCPGDSVRPGETCPVRSPFTLLEFDTANVARLPGADTGGITTGKGNHYGNTKHGEMVQRGEGLRLHRA